jgi:SAM-dependent methyltransferase
MHLGRSMLLRPPSTVLAAMLALACTRSSEQRDARIGRTTYDGAEQLHPASGTTAPRPDPTLELPLGTEDEGEPTETSEPADPPDTGHAQVPDVVYVPTPQPVVDKMLELAKVRKDDLVYDLGCGDGRIVVTAAKRYGARAVGFDIDPARVAEARAQVKGYGLEHLVRIEQKDLFTVDLSPATVVTLYLLPELNDRLVPQLEGLAVGSRVVSHDYGITGVVPTRELAVRPNGEKREHPVFLYTLPFERPRVLSLPPPIVRPPVVP